ncbi:substrate-binding domain-containing protein [Klebsiella pneumoniae subsp. pneumoniae]|nr:substrate-binding domain-containing protein [Klebsiella pneumoniae subsp. pneumoniae]
MTNTTLTLLAAGSLRSAFLPLVAHFRQHTGLAVDAQFGPAGCCASGSKPGRRARFCFRQRGAPAGAAAGGSGAGMPGFASNQLMLTARRSPDNDGLDWLALLSTTRLRLATSTPGCDPSGDYTGSCSPELRHAIQGWATRWPGGRSSWSAAETH